MAWYDDDDIVHEIEMLEEEEFSWLTFCNVARSMMRFAFRNNMPNNYDIQQGGYGERLVQRVLSQPSGDDCLQLCRMRPPAFRRLVAHLKQHYAYKGTRHISAEQRLAFTLFILGHSAGMRLAHIFFGHSTSTIHAHFHYVLDKLYELSMEMVKPHPQYMYGVEHHRPTDPRHAPFMDCIGAIDGTHVPAVPPHESAERYRNRKGMLTQNVLAVVDFNMCFTFASASWEGSTHDSRMLKVAMEDPNSGFPFPYGNKYYLVDSGFAHRTGFLGPYRGDDTRYHIQEFARASTSRARQPRSREERFNYLHSSCRNIVERSFGVWKKRFLILQRMPEYHISAQSQIVIATMTVHNFIRRVDMMDPGFVAAMMPEYTPMEPDDSIVDEALHVRRRASDDRVQWDQFRESITSSISD